MRPKLVGLDYVRTGIQQVLQGLRNLGCASSGAMGGASGPQSGAQPELTASAQELIRMLQVIEDEILPKTAQGVAAGNKASPRFAMPRARCGARHAGGLCALRP